jgi:Scramblase
MMNVLMGFEQANRYVIMDPQGNHIGFLAEQEHGIGNAVARQAFRTHRSFTTHVFDKNEREVLRFHRPFSWISSRIRVYDAVNKDHGMAYSASNSPEDTASQTSSSISPLPVTEMRIIGEAQQQWAPLRRKYNLFLFRDTASLTPQSDTESPAQLTAGDLPLSSSTALRVADQDKRSGTFVQFASVNEPFLSWDFTLLSSTSQLIGSVNRNFAGFGREIFTDTGVYALRMDAAGLAAEAKSSHLISRSGRDVDKAIPGMTLDQRAVMLATAVSIDFDYFSRHSNAGSGGWFPFFPIWWGGEAAEVGAVGTASEAGAVGAASEAGSTAVGGVARGAGSIGASEGVITGAGTMAGYEAMQRGRQQHPDDTSPVSDTTPSQQQPDGQSHDQSSEEVWGEDWPWGGGDQGGGSNPPSSGGGGASSGGGGEGGGGFDWGDWF